MLIIADYNELRLFQKHVNGGRREENLKAVKCLMCTIRTDFSSTITRPRSQQQEGHMTRCTNNKSVTRKLRRRFKCSKNRKNDFKKIRINALTML